MDSIERAVRQALDNGRLGGGVVIFDGRVLRKGDPAPAEESQAITYNAAGWSHQTNSIGARRSQHVDKRLAQLKADGSELGQYLKGWTIGRIWQERETAATFVANDPTRFTGPSAEWLAANGLSYTPEELEQVITNLAVVDNRVMSMSQGGGLNLREYVNSYRGQEGRNGHVQFNPGFHYADMNDYFRNPAPGAIKVPNRPHFPDSVVTASHYGFKDNFGARIPVQGQSFPDNWVFDLWWDVTTDAAWGRSVDNWLIANGWTPPD